LDHVSLVIRAGEKMALVGLDSAQKEALLLLPGRLVSPLTGDLRWDRLNIRLAEPTSLRKQIGVVSGQGQLFHGTILENITAGDCAITEAQAEEAASVARLDGHVRALAHGYQTIVGPHGKVLPEVLQFQITLARAMLRNPSLLLVVEPRIETGSDSSDILDDALSRALAGKTAFVCPTRLSTLSLCDQIAVIDRGKVNAVGTHKPLSEDNALYRHMLRTGF
jgi:ATP-binding cassette subfamily B protein